MEIYSYWTTEMISSSYPDLTVKAKYVANHEGESIWPLMNPEKEISLSSLTINVNYVASSRQMHKKTPSEADGLWTACDHNDESIFLLVNHDERT